MSLEKHEHVAVVRIVGIGASAGGLEALAQFFSRVPVGSGLAYIVVQHLDPTQKAMLAELLQRVTSLSV
ncbi:MAG: chemotaxis protein CheB, partial [Casimicrobiaceae bacterium]